MTTPEEMAERIAREVEKKGGRTYYVGGFVRDRVLGIENKDVDIEVHGVTAGVLEQILDALGQRTQMGASFGVYGLKHLDLDIALPRKEEATGRGHRDFAVFTDPWLGTEKAARRRDFTMNALMEDVVTGEIIDHFGGREDAKGHPAPRGPQELSGGPSAGASLRPVRRPLWILCGTGDNCVM